MLEHLCARENEFLHENRELRGMVSVLSILRILRFSQHSHSRRMRLIGDFKVLELEVTSLDGSGDHGKAETSSDSSTEGNSNFIWFSELNR